MSARRRFGDYEYFLLPVGHLELRAAAVLEEQTDLRGKDPEYPLFAITFKTAGTNFAELSSPIISRLTAGAS